MAPRAPRVPFVVLVLGVLVAGLVGLLLLNTALQRGAYVATDLRQTSSELTITEQRLALEVAALGEPQRVASEAQRLGMVQNDSPAFLELSTGQIIGTPVAGRRKNQVDVSDATPVVVSSQGSKVPLIVAGRGNSLTTGPVVIEDPHADDGKHAQSDEAAGSGR